MKRVAALLLSLMMLCSSPLEILASQVANVPLPTEIETEETTEEATEETTEVETEVEREEATEAETEVEPEEATEVETEAETEVETEEATEVETEEATEVETEETTEVETEPGTEVETEVETEPATEVETELETEVATEVITEPETEASTEVLIEETESVTKLATSGTLGYNNGFQWTYDEESNTLTITGEDTGIFLKQYENRVEAEHYVFENCTFNGSLYGLFEDDEVVKSVDFINCDTTNVTNMSAMFGHCSNLTSLDISELDTSNVTDMSYMFNGCSSLTSLDVTGLDTSSATNMVLMFYDCSGLESLDVSGFDTSNVTNMAGMFGYCSGLESLDLSGFNTSNVTDMSGMFERCSLKNLDLSVLDTSNVTSMMGMFSEWSEASLDLSGLDTSNVTDMLGMFQGCSLESLDLSGLDTSNVTDMTVMFEGCSNLTSLDLSGFDTSKVIAMMAMFNGCSSLTSLDISGLDTSNVTDMSDMFGGCNKLETIHTSKKMSSTVSMSLPYKFSTPTGEVIAECTAEHADIVLTKCRKIDNITLSKDKLELTDSVYEDTITVTLEATGGDENTTFELWYENPDTAHSFQVVLSYQEDGKYVGELYASYLVNGAKYEKENIGVYTLSSIYTNDGNTYDSTGITSQFTYNVTVEDISAPVVNKVTLYDSNGNEIVAGQTFQKTDKITIKMDVTDESQIDSVRLENPYYIYVWYDEEEQAYVETIDLEQLETGVHYISINADDIYGNYAEFYYNDSLYFYVADENGDLPETTYTLNFYMDGENSMEASTYEVTGKGEISLKELFPDGIPEAPTYEGISFVGWEIEDIGTVTEEEEFVPRSTELNICPVYDKCRIVAKCYYFSDPVKYNTVKAGGYNSVQNIAFFVDNKEITKEELLKGIEDGTFDTSSIIHSTQLKLENWDVSNINFNQFEACGDVILQAKYDKYVGGINYTYINEAGEVTITQTGNMSDSIIYDKDDTYEEVVSRIKGENVPHTNKYTFIKWLNLYDDALTETGFQNGRIVLKAAYIAIEDISLNSDTMVIDDQNVSANIDVSLEVADMVFQNVDMQGADAETEFQLIYAADDGYEIPVTLTYQDGKYVGKINVSGDDYDGEGDFVLSSITIDGKEANYTNESKFTLINNSKVNQEYTITYKLDGGKIIVVTQLLTTPPQKP